MEISLLDTTLIAFDRLALATIIGASAAFIWLLKDTHARALVQPKLRFMIDGALITLLITTTVILLMRSATMADVSLLAAFPFVEKVVEKSHFGSLWAGRAIALIIMMILWLFIRKKTPPLSGALLIAASAAIAFYISATSHAGDEGLFTLDNLTNSIHIIGGCLWGGAVIAYLVIISTLRQQSNAMHEIICSSADRLTSLATVALALVISTGLLNAWHRLETVAELWQTDYGITLMIKFGFVVMMMVIGASNRFIIIPAMTGKPAASGRFQRVLSLDALLFITIICIAAALGIQGPGEH
ncbi:MAG: CopD family protein [Gammaproteobacteria bacterium]|nr:CopD family protein [Gammaproteobacteria bacterium]